ncbi:MAG: hypothetical protein QOK23_4814 [Gammaproteobacteria bacterium]|jgi:hypothetical protein|nr:hypothetical protein [Gammaproteobacteria bacterium]
MLTKTKIALAAALILGGTASAALARGSYGGPHQTWCDINPACNGWDQRMDHRSYDHARNAYGYVPAHKHVSHAR